MVTNIVHFCDNSGKFSFVLYEFRVLVEKNSFQQAWFYENCVVCLRIEICNNLHFKAHNYH